MRGVVGESWPASAYPRQEVGATPTIYARAEAIEQEKERKRQERESGKAAAAAEAVSFYCGCSFVCMFHTTHSSADCGSDAKAKTEQEASG